TSEDGNLTLTIPKDTTSLDEDGDPLDSLEAAVDESPPHPPEDAHIIGLAYDFGPDGATFDPPITLEYTYDPDVISGDIAEEDLVLAYYDENAGEWVELNCVIDTENNTITASVEHFTTFTIMAHAAPTPTLLVPSAPAAFSVSNLTVNPADLQPKEAATITVTVANTGGTGGTHTVTFKINGLKEAETSVTIAAGSSEIVTFSAAREEAGTYSVTVDGLSAGFTVAAPPSPPPPTPPREEEEPEAPAKPPINWLLIGAIIAGVVVVGLLVFLLVRRRAY
ncbi:CARDB domain-containing protein, partial [Chloroflexota bacterium]